MRVRWSAAGSTDIGRVRERNEDAFRLAEREGIFLVADGMGGHAAGEVASALAADAVLDVLARAIFFGPPEPTRAIPAAFSEARTRLSDRRRADPELDGMGTTLTVAVVQPDGSLHIGHIGDSRLYRLNNGRLAQLTHDHTWTQQEVDAGRIPIEAARSHPFSHVLTRVLAVEEPSDPDVHSTHVAPGDVLLLCSDGLHNAVDGPELLDLLGRPEPAETIVRRLIDAANDGGGQDNITALVVQISQGSPGS